MGEIADISGLIYRITCKTNGRCYVGSTTNLALRKRQHLHLLRAGRHHSLHLQRAFEKYGEVSIAWDVIEDVSGDLLAAEARAIRALKPAFNSGDAHPTRLGARQSAACKSKVSAANTGRRHTPEARVAISASLRGNRRAAGNANARKVTPEIRAEIHRLAGDGLGSYRIAKVVGLSKKTIINVRHGRH